eukprot:scaffold14520_cov109-Isochrysis_galbana.AAC.4
MVGVQPAELGQHGDGSLPVAPATPQPWRASRSTAAQAVEAGRQHPRAARSASDRSARWRRRRRGLHPATCTLRRSHWTIARPAAQRSPTRPKLAGGAGASSHCAPRPPAAILRSP